MHATHDVFHYVVVLLERKNFGNLFVPNYYPITMDTTFSYPVKNKSFFCIFNTIQGHTIHKHKLKYNIQQFYSGICVELYEGDFQSPCFRIKQRTMSAL